MSFPLPLTVKTQAGSLILILSRMNRRASKSFFMNFIFRYLYYTLSVLFMAINELETRRIVDHVNGDIAAYNAIIPDEEYLHSIGVSSAGSGLVLPSSQFRRLAYLGVGKKAIPEIEIVDGVYMVGFGNDKPEPMFSAEPGLDLVIKAHPEMAWFSQAAAVVDFVAGGIYPARNQHTLSPRIVLQGLADLSIGQQIRDRLNADRGESGLDLVMKAVEGFVAGQENLYTSLCIDRETAETLVFRNFVLEFALMIGHDGLIEDLISQDPKALTVVLGTKAAWLLSHPDKISDVMSSFLALESRHAEFTPEDLLDFDQVGRNGFGNVLGLASDLTTARVFPRCFRLANLVSSLKTGEADYLWRQRVVTGSPTTVGFLGLESLDGTLVSDPHLSIGIKSGLGLLRKSIRGNEDGLFSIWSKRRPLVSFSNLSFLKGLTGLEALLATYRQGDDGLLNQIVTKMQKNPDDIRMRLFVSSERFGPGHATSLTGARYIKL